MQHQAGMQGNAQFGIYHYYTTYEKYELKHKNREKQIKYILEHKIIFITLVIKLVHLFLEITYIKETTKTDVP